MSFSTHNFNADEVVAATTLQGIQDAIDAIAPVGSYLMVHMTPPAGGTLVNGAWLACDGTAVSSSAYVNLFNKIGTTYGNPGGGQFNLPDFRGRTMLVAASGGNSDASLGKNDGAALASRRPKHSHTVSNNHSHSVSGVILASGDSHTHDAATITTNAIFKGGGTTRPYGSTAGNTGPSAGASVLHSHTLSGTMNAASTDVTAVGVSGMTDGPAYLVCCTVLIRAL